MKKLFFALITSFIFVATAWGQCTETIFASHQMASIGGSTDTYEYNFIAGRRVKELTLYLQRNSWAGVGPFKIYELGTGSKIYDKRPTDSNSGDYITLTISENATGIKFSNEMTCKANLWNVVITYRPWIEIPTDDLYFGIVEKGASSQRSITIEHSALNESITASSGNSAFAFSNPVVKSGTCGPTTLNISFKPTEYGVYTNQLEFSNGTKVFLRGECSTNFDTKAANFAVEKVSYTSIKLKWNAVPGASGYRIVNQTNGASYTVDANTTSLNATGLKMETNYSFVFYALFNGATSLNATLASATTLKKEGVVIEDCPKFYENYDAKEQTIGVVGYNKPMIYDNISITGNLPSYKVRFRAKMTTGSVVGKPDLCMYVKLKGKDNYEPNVYWEGRAAGLDDTHREYFVEVPQNTVAIKFDCDENGQL